MSHLHSALSTAASSPANNWAAIGMKEEDSFELISFSREVLKQLFQKATKAPLTAEDQKIVRDIITTGKGHKIPKGAEKIYAEAEKVQRLLESAFQPITKTLKTGALNQPQAIAETQKLFDKLPETEHPAIDALFAQVILSTEKLHHRFSYTIQSYTDTATKKAPSIAIPQLLEMHNTYGLPRKDLAGTTYAQISGQRIFFDKEGLLQIGTELDRIKRSEHFAFEIPVLDKTQLKEIYEIYKENGFTRPFNNAIPLIEFMSFYRECKKTNKDLSLSEAFMSFRPDPLKMFEKYQGGNCVIISAQLQHELAKAGYHSYQLSKPIENIATILPIISLDGNFGIPWQEHLKSAKNIAHIDTLIPFREPDGKISSLILSTSLEQKDDCFIATYDSLEDLHADIKEDYTEEGSFPIEAFDAILKKRLAASYKLIISEPGNPKSVFGVDLLEGNIYLSSAGMKGLEATLPLSKTTEKVSIPLKGLTDGSSGIYIIGGAEKQMKHSMAFASVIEKTKKRFQLPQDIRENIVTLAELLPAYFHEIAMQPMPLIKKYYKEIKEINRSYFAILQATLAGHYSTNAFAACQQALNDIHEALNINNEQELCIALDRYKHARS